MPTGPYGIDAALWRMLPPEDQVAIAAAVTGSGQAIGGYAPAPTPTAAPAAPSVPASSAPPPNLSSGTTSRTAGTGDYPVAQVVTNPTTPPLTPPSPGTRWTLASREAQVGRVGDSTSVFDDGEDDVLVLPGARRPGYPGITLVAAPAAAPMTPPPTPVVAAAPSPASVQPGLAAAASDADVLILPGPRLPLLNGIAGVSAPKAAPPKGRPPRPKDLPPPPPEGRRPPSPHWKIPRPGDAPRAPIVDTAPAVGPIETAFAVGVPDGQTPPLGRQPLSDLNYRDFINASWDERKAWVARLSKEFDGWFNNILGILDFLETSPHFFNDARMQAADGWVLWTLAVGYRGWKQGVGPETKWTRFMTAEKKGKADSVLRQLWADAESEAVHGVATPLSEGQPETHDQDGLYDFFVWGGDRYRQNVKENDANKILGFVAGSDPRRDRESVRDLSRWLEIFYFEEHLNG
jgi:hypothetical protein